MDTNTPASSDNPVQDTKQEIKVDKNYFKNLKKLAPMQMFSIVSMLLIGLTLPITIFMALSPIKPIITPASGPVTPPDNPPPTIGNAPVIITTELEKAAIGKQYKQVIEGYDLDTGDELTFQVEGLPEGYELGQCHANIRKVNGVSEDKINYLSCSISGKTEKFGEFPVELTILDGFNFTQRTLTLKIQ